MARLYILKIINQLLIIGLEFDNISKNFFHKFAPE